MTANNHSGAAHDGARSHDGASQGASGGSARRASGTGAGCADGLAWAGRGRGSGGWAGVGRSPEAEVTEADVAAADVAAVESESADLPLWDWSPPGETVPADDFQDAAMPLSGPPRAQVRVEARGHSGRGGRGRSAAAAGHRPAPGKPGAPGRRPAGCGSGSGGSSSRSSSGWLFSILFSWQVGLTLAVIAAIADTIYRSRRGVPRPGEGPADRRAAPDPQAAGQTGARGLPRHEREPHPGERGADRPPGGRARGRVRHRLRGLGQAAGRPDEERQAAVARPVQHEGPARACPLGVGAGR